MNASMSKRILTNNNFKDGVETDEAGGYIMSRISHSVVISSTFYEQLCANIRVAKNCKEKL
jgi:hypothetical protein